MLLTSKLLQARFSNLNKMVAVWCLAQGQLYSVMAHMYIALVGYPQECYGQQKICLISKSENLPPNNFRNYQSRSVILLK